MRQQGQITAEKISLLGRAISANSELLLELYKSREPIEAKINSKLLNTLRDNGVIEVNPKGGIILGSHASAIFDRVAKKAHRLHVMPTIEVWKENIMLLSQQAKTASYSADVNADEDTYLDDISDHIRDMCRALSDEMASIERTINIDLNNSPSIKSKRITLNYLLRKIRLQMDMLQGLSNQELQACDSGHIKVSTMLNSISDLVASQHNELNLSLQKTLDLIGQLEKEQQQKRDMVWRLHHNLRNNRYIPENTPFGHDDLTASAIAVGGIDFGGNQTVIEPDYNENSYMLVNIVNGMAKESSLNATTAGEGNVNDQDVIDEGQGALNQELTEVQLVGYDFFKYNSTNAHAHNLSAYEFWQRYELDKIVDYKPFLALILHKSHSDFENDHVMREDDTYQWKLFIKTKKATDISDTTYVQDARYYLINKNDGEPSKDIMWIKH